MNNIFQESFTKIRITSKVKETDTSRLLQIRSDLKEKLKNSPDDDQIEEELTTIEEKIVKEVSEVNRKKVVDNFKSLANTDGSSNINGMWNLKKKTFPKNLPTLPTAKKDSRGNLVSTPEELKILYLNTYTHRLRHRPMVPEMEELRKLKEILCSKRLEMARKTKSIPWTEK